MSEYIDPENPPVERHDGGTDWRRVGVEVNRAGIILRASLRFVRDYEHEFIEVIDDDLGTMLTIPHYRVASFATDQLRPFVAMALESMPPELAERALERINEGHAVTEDDPREFHVRVSVDLGLGGERPAILAVTSVHRGNLMQPNWPLLENNQFVDIPPSMVSAS